MLTTLLMIWAERRVIGRMQQRPGPNRAGKFGLLQTLMDGIKLPLKEDIVPRGVDKILFWLAPAIATIPAFISFAIAMGISFVPVFLYAGSLSTSQIVAAQAHGSTFHLFGAVLHYPSWFAILLLPSFVIYVITMVGETNRLPFDLPEGEGELVAGFHTEYSSLKFALFYLAEYVNMITVSALATTLFLGGWHAIWPISVWSGANSGWWPALWFLAKLIGFLFFFIWLRGSLPRIRYDQLMSLGWKILIPGGLAWTLLIATLRVWRRQGGSTGVYLIGGLIIAVLLVLTFAWDFASARTAERRAVEEEESAEQDAGAFPVPPMDLPHYHGIAGSVPALTDQAPDSGVGDPGRPGGAAGVKEVTGA